MSNYQKNKIVAICFMIAHCFFMSLDIVLLKKIQAQYNIMQIMFCYYCIVFLTLIIFFYKKLTIPSVDIKYHFLRSIFGFGGFMLFYYSLSKMPINEVRSILSLDPIITTFFAILFFREKFNIMKLSSLIITFIGALIMLHPGNIKLSIGILTSLLCAVCFGVFNNITKKISKGSSIDQIFYLSFFSLFYTLLPSIYYWKPIAEISDILILFCIALSFILSSITIVCAFKRAELSFIMPMNFMGVIITAAFGYLFFQEVISYTTMFGSLIITLGTIPLFIKHS